MDKIRQWALTVSAVSILSGILLALLPENSRKSSFKFLVSIILIYSVLRPLTGSQAVDFEIGDYLKDNYSVSENYDKYALSAMISSAEKSIENLLCEKVGTSDSAIEFECKCIAEENEIRVSRIGVSGLKTTDEIQKIKELIINLGFEEELIVFEGTADEH